MVEAEAGSPTGELLGRWISTRLQIPVSHVPATGGGVSAVRLRGANGEICIARGTLGQLAILTIPGQPPRTIALPSPRLGGLPAEEMRLPGPDVAYARALNAE